MGKRRKDWMSSQVGRRKTVLQLNDHHKHVEESPPLSPRRLPSGYPAWSPPRHIRPGHSTKESGLAGERSMDAEVAEFLKEISALSTSEEAEAAAANADSESVEEKESKIDGNTKKVEKDKQDLSVETNNHTVGNDATSWQECWDERTQFHYYWNVGTNEVSWHPPPGFPAHPDLIATNDSGSQKMDTDDDDLEEKVELITFYGPPSPEVPLKRKKKPKAIGPQLPAHVVKEQSSLDPRNCEVEEPIIYGPHLPAEKPEKIVSIDSPKYGPPLPPDMKLLKPDINDHVKKRRKHNIIEKDILEEADLLLAQKNLLKQLKSEEEILASLKSKKSSTRSIIEEEKFWSRDSPLSEGQCSKSSEDEQPISHSSFTGVETPSVFSSPIIHKPNVNDFNIETSLIKKKRKDDKEKRYRRHKEHKMRKHSRDESDKKHHHKEKHRKHLETSISSASSASSTEEVQRLRRHKENLKKASKPDHVEMNNKKLEHSKIPPPSHPLPGTHYYEDEDTESEKMKKGIGSKLDQENLLRKNIRQLNLQNRSSSLKKQNVNFDKSEKTELPLIKIKQEVIEDEPTSIVSNDDTPEEPIDYEEIDRQLELALEKKLKGDDKVVKKSKSKHNFAKPAIKEKDEKTRSGHKVSEKTKSIEQLATPKSPPVVVKEKEEKSSKPPKIDNNSNSSSPNDAISVETIEEMARTICEKLEFLDVSRKTISKLHILILELETRVMDYHAGALEKHYFISKLKEAANQLHQFENSAVPTGWSCHWDRDFKRYFYSNGITGQTQWDYPEEKAVPENVESCKTDEQLETETKKTLKEKKNIKVEPHRTLSIPSSIPILPIVESSEPPPPGVDDIPPPLPTSDLAPPLPLVHPQTVDLEEGEIEDVEMEIEDSSSQPDSSYPSNSELGLVIAKPPQPAASNYYLYSETNCIAAPGVFPTHPPVPVGGFPSQTIAYSNYPAALQPNIAIYTPHPVVISNPNPPQPVAPPVEVSPPTQPDVQTNGTKVEEVKSIKKEKKFKKKKISLSLKKKNLSSLVEKWQQIKEEVARISESESDEEKPTTFEEWKRQQIESGEALDNANFEEIGDWRARLLKSKSKKP